MYTDIPGDKSLLVFGVSWALGTVLSDLQTHLPPSSPHNHEVDTSMRLALQMRLRETEPLAQAHRAREWHSQDLNPGLSDSRTEFSIAAPFVPESSGELFLSALILTFEGMFLPARGPRKGSLSLRIAPPKNILPSKWDKAQTPLAFRT